MKRLKYLFMALVMVICMLGSSVPVSASSYSTGKAVIPHFFLTPIFNYYIDVSNITDNPIEVTLTLYDKDGSIIKDDNNVSAGQIKAYTVLNYCDQNVDSTASFTLNPHCTGIIELALNPIGKYGYGVIEWKQNGSIMKGLISCGYMYNYKNDSTTVQSISYFDINGGLPF